MRRRVLCILLFLLGVWILAIQLGCMPMRTPDKKWREKLSTLGQQRPPTFHDVTAPDGRNVHVVGLSGADSLPPVALVHGSPGSADAFLDYLGDTALTQYVNPFSVDRPGFGYSGFGKPEPSLAKQAAAVKAAADVLAPNQRLVLVGHSLGGPVIVQFAVDYPEQTAALVLVAGSVDPAAEKHPWWQVAVDNPPLCWLTPKSLWASNYEIRRLEAELDLLKPRWPDIRCPVYILHATNDRLVPYSNVAFARSMLVNAAKVEVETYTKGDHFILWNNREAVRRVILKASVGGSARGMN